MGKFLMCDWGDYPRELPTDHCALSTFLGEQVVDHLLEGGAAHDAGTWLGHVYEEILLFATAVAEVGN